MAVAFAHAQKNDLSIGIGMLRRVLDKLGTSPSMYHSIDVDRMRNKAMEMQLGPLDARLGKQPWLLGAEWSVLDAYLYWVWFRITGAGFPGEKFPNIAAHAQRMEDRPAVKRALAREAQAESDLEAKGLAVKFDQMAGTPRARR